MLVRRTGFEVGKLNGWLVEEGNAYGGPRSRVELFFGSRVYWLILWSRRLFEALSLGSGIRDGSCIRTAMQ